MTGRWRKHLGKACDFYFKLESDPLWGLDSQFEPVLIFVALPFLPHRPNFDGKAHLCERFRGILQEPEVREVHSPLQRDILRQLFLEARELLSL